MTVETHKRSLVKALSWRVFATLTTISISYVVTHKVGAALTIGSIEVVAKIFLYYAHERIWNSVRALNKPTPKAC